MKCNVFAKRLFLDCSFESAFIGNLLYTPYLEEHTSGGVLCFFQNNKKMLKVHVVILGEPLSMSLLSGDFLQQETNIENSHHICI